MKFDKINDWEDITCEFFKKYPDLGFLHTNNIHTLSAFINSDGFLEVSRLVEFEITRPAFLKRFPVFLKEKIYVDGENRIFYVFGRNLTWKEYNIEIEGENKYPKNSFDFNFGMKKK